MRFCQHGIDGIWMPCCSWNLEQHESEVNHEHTIGRFIFFNDRYGHQEGDRKLKQLAHLIGQIVPNGASVFRSGGDEFVIFLIGRQMAEVVSVAIYVWNTINQQFLSLPALERSYYFPDKSRLKIEAPLAISCGVAFYPAHGISFASLCEAANNAMYQDGCFASLRNNHNENNN